MGTQRRIIGVLGVILILLGACGSLAVIAPSGMLPQARPLWQCPTPMSAALPTSIAAAGPTVTPPPTATPYYRGDTFFLGQDVYVNPVRITVHAVTTHAAPITTTQTVVVDLELATTQAISLDLTTQVAIREVRSPDGSGVRGWWRAERLVDSRLPNALVAGESWRGTMTIQTPVGDPTEIQVVRSPAEAAVTYAPQASTIMVRTIRDPWCAANIARPPLAPSGGGGIDGTPIPVPPGTNPIVAFAVAHLGYPYVWGAKGPNAFDCSGLVYAAHQTQLGITLPVGTTAPNGGQWLALTPIAASEVQPGDLLFFHTFPASPPPSHVGIYVGDLDGDGTGDMIHAANPTIGVVFQGNVFGSAYFMQQFVGARRVPGIPVSGAASPQGGR